MSDPTRVNHSNQSRPCGSGSPLSEKEKFTVS